MPKLLKPPHSTKKTGEKPSRIGMETTKHVDTKIGHHHGGKRHHKIDEQYPGTAEGGDVARMKRYRVQDKRHQRPCLLGIPVPITPPRDVGPYRAEDDADAEQQDSGIEQDRRQQRHRPLTPGHEQSRQSHGKRECEQRIRGHDDRHMYGKPRRGKHRHERRYLWIKT